MKNADEATPINHNAAIEALAATMGTSVVSVADAYQHELAQLEQDARITQFLPLLTARRVRDRLRSHRDDRRWR